MKGEKVCIHCYDKNKDHIIQEHAKGECERKRRGCRGEAEKVVASEKPFRPEKPYYQ